MRTLKIKKVDGKPVVIRIKEKAKIHSHEPKGAKIKGSNIYTVERGSKTTKVSVEKAKAIGAKNRKLDTTEEKKSYRRSTIHQAEAEDKGLSRFKRNVRESNVSIKTKQSNLHIAGRTGAMAAGAVNDQLEGGQEDTLINNAKKALTEAQQRLNTRCEQIKNRCWRQRNRSSPQPKA